MSESGGSLNQVRQAATTCGLISIAVVSIFSFLKWNLVNAADPSPSCIARRCDTLSGSTEQQPGHHALDILELDLERLLDQHAALDPFGAQVQEADLGVLRDRDLGQVVGVGAGAGLRGHQSASLGIRPWRANTSRHASVLRARLQLALAGLVEGSR